MIWKHRNSFSFYWPPFKEMPINGVHFHFIIIFIRVDFFLIISTWFETLKLLFLLLAPYQRNSLQNNILFFENPYNLVILVYNVTIFYYSQYEKFNFSWLFQRHFFQKILSNFSFVILESTLIFIICWQVSKQIF